MINQADPIFQIFYYLVTDESSFDSQQEKYTMDPGSEIDRSNQKIILSKK